ncbi:MAG TPA: hypothetical protein VIM75_20735 [Ohtaekwangia sp.]
MKITVPPDVLTVRLPGEAELAIVMIRKELNSRRAVYHLEQAGFPVAIPAYNFRDTVLELVGFTDPSDQLCQWYDSLLEQYARTTDTEVVSDCSRQAFELYLDLATVRRTLHSPSDTARPS